MYIFMLQGSCKSLIEEGCVDGKMSVLSRTDRHTGRAYNLCVCVCVYIGFDLKLTL